MLSADWQRLPMHTRPIGFLYWGERFGAGDQWVYSLITPLAGDALVIEHALVGI
jgi:hypothetical protein